MIISDLLISNNNYNTIVHSELPLRTAGRGALLLCWNYVDIIRQRAHRFWEIGQCYKYKSLHRFRCPYKYFWISHSRLFNVHLYYSNYFFILECYYRGINLLIWKTSKACSGLFSKPIKSKKITYTLKCIIMLYWLLVII